ncbi:Glycerophosphodiester phosphodiesterase gdpd6 [Salvia divinorum]|uniref:glycerophosphodiester phosphodiesterase n=1 Tax=Salvia divinorum TaxID=28513 RepID=A0ABD1GC52_SALDI
MASPRLVPFVFLLLIVGCSARALYPLPSRRNDGNKQPLQTFRAYNVAHRGSSGVLPEETIAAYIRAIEDGADFIEADILASKDGFLICFHDVILDTTTDVANHTLFARRKRTYEVEGINMTGFFQRKEYRDPQYNGMFSIITFEEYIQIALDAPRVVGIYPEIKNPVFINQRVQWPGGKKFEDVFVETLIKYGYKGTYLSEQWMKRPAFIQSFAPTSLTYLSKLTDLPKIFLIDDTTVLTQDTNQSYWEITSDKYLEYISEYVVGIGPWKNTIIPVANNYLQTPTDLVARAHARNLQVHPYTFRNEYPDLRFNFSQDPYKGYAFWINEVGVDRLFTDFPKSLHHYQQWTSPSQLEKRMHRACSIKS